MIRRLMTDRRSFELRLTATSARLIDSARFASRAHLQDIELWPGSSGESSFAKSVSRDARLSSTVFMVSVQMVDADGPLNSDWPFEGMAVSLRWLFLWRAVQVGNVSPVWRKIPSFMGYRSRVPQGMPLC